jgi:hypothetical protein
MRRIRFELAGAMLDAELMDTATAKAIDPALPSPRRQ